MRATPRLLPGYPGIPLYRYRAQNQDDIGHGDLAVTVEVYCEQLGISEGMSPDYTHHVASQCLYIGSGR
jgi:hypothetical protein